MQYHLPEYRNQLKRLCGIFGIVGLAWVLTTPADAMAGDWMFRRSYHSHVLPPELEYHMPLPESRSAYRTPVVRYHPGFSIRGGQRFNNYTLRSGNSTDWTIIRENWIEIRP